VTGSSISIKLLDEGFVAGLDHLAAAGANTEPLMRAIGVGLVDVTQRRFENGLDPEGKRWAGLNPAYAAVKRGPSILRGAAMQGGLMSTITFTADRFTVRVGSNRVYAAIHQFGGTIVPKKGRFLVFRLGTRVIHARKVTIPARPYLGFGAEDRRVIAEAIELELREALRGT
jgi:phage virion morphogenesis protein